MSIAPNNSNPEFLDDYLLVDTHSMQDAHDVAARSFVPHTLTKTDASPDFHFVHSHAFMQDISLCYTSYGANLILEPEPMDNFYLIQMPVSGLIELDSGGVHRNLNGMEGSIVSPTNRTCFKWSEDSGLITIKVERQALEYHLRRLCQSEVVDPIEFEVAMSLSDPKYRNWYIEVVRMMQYFQHSKRTEAVALEGWFEQKLMEILLFSQTNNYSEQLMQQRYTAPSKAVGEAMQYMHAHIDEKISLATLADVTGVTARTLHNGFKRFRDVSPLDYLTEIRLQKVRFDLEHADDSDTVTSIAQSVGFTHLGRFSHKYFQHFGELPSQTINRC